MRLDPLPKLILFFCLVAVARPSHAQNIVTYAGGIGNDTTAALYGRFLNPMLIADGSGGLYITDDYGGIRRIDIATNRLTVVTTGGGKGAIDATGNWYYISAYRVYKKDPAGNVTHIAGNGSVSFNFDGIPATAAGMHPVDVAVDASGNVYIADQNNHRARKVNTLGMISTYAGGSGGGGFSGDGGAATLARLNFPSGIAVDALGNIYIADENNNRIRKVTISGIITTCAGNGGSSPLGDGGPATNAGIGEPRAIEVDGAGNLYISSFFVTRVRKVSASGVISTIAGNGSTGFTGDGGPATAASFNEPADIAVNPAGGIYIADNGNNRIRCVNASGIVSTIAGNGVQAGGYGGDGGNAMLGRFAGINWLALNSTGALYISDGSNNRIRKVSASGVLSTVAGMGLGSVFGDGGQATAAGIGSPASVATDKLGNFYIAAADVVRKVSPSGIITVFAGGAGGTPNGIPATSATIGQPKGIAADAAGNIYVANSYGGEIYKIDAVTGIITTVAGNGDGSSTTGDGGPATAAGLAHPNSIAFDKMGNMYIGGDQARKVNTSGIITSLPCDGNSIAVDTMGNVYLVDGSIVRRYDIHGYLSVVTGAAPASCIVIDTMNNLFFALGSTVKKMGPLSTVIDYPPLFVKGISATTTVCASSTSNVIDTFLRVTDMDMGQTLMWTITSGPLHGSLAGLPQSALSTGGVVVPGGISYTPVTGYMGSDVIKIKVSDGEDTAMIQLNITVTATASAGSITGTNKVCVGASIDLNATIGGGTWSTNGTEAVVNDTGLVTGITAGIDTVIYTINTYCGLRSAILTFSVNQIPAPQIGEPVPTLCVNVWTNFTATPSGGTWSIAQGPLQVLSNGQVRGNAVGTGLVVYTKANECGTGSDTVAVTAIDRPEAGTITGVMTGCPGDVGTYASTMPGGKWYSTNQSVATIDSVSGGITFVAAGNATISYRVANVCGGNSAVKGVYVPFTPYAGTITGDLVLCNGSAGTLSNTVSSGVWSSGDTLIASIDNTGAVRAKQEGTVPVSYTITNTCGTGSTVANLTILTAPELTPIAGKSIVIKGSTVTLRGRAPVGIWSSSNAAIATINQWGDLTGVANGTAVITYSETNGNNCTSAEIFEVLVTSSTDIVLSVYPVPANRTLNVAYKKSAAMDADIQFTDILGRVISKGKMNMPASTGIAQFDVSLFPAGVYTISIISSDGNYIGRIVVAH